MFDQGIIQFVDWRLWETTDKILSGIFTVSISRNILLLLSVYEG